MTTTSDKAAADLVDHVRAEARRAPQLTREQLDQLAVVLRPTIAEHCRARVPRPRSRRRAP